MSYKLPEGSWSMAVYSPIVMLGFDPIAMLITSISDMIMNPYVLIMAHPKITGICGEKHWF
jgi:hypothetical protein